MLLVMARVYGHQGGLGRRVHSQRMLQRRLHPGRVWRIIMSTTALMLPVTDDQSLADWSAVAFVASYSSPGTRQAYATQVRLWFQWCRAHGLEPLTDVRRPHVELYARELEAARAGPGPPWP